MLNKQTVALSLLIFVGVVSYFILKPFILAIVCAAILGILFSPLYKWLLKKIKSPNWCAFVTCLIALFIVLIPTFFVSQALFTEAASVVRNVASQNVSSQDIVGSVSVFFDKVASYIPGVESVDVKTFSLNMLKSVSEWFRVQVLTIPSRVLLVLLSVFLFYYMLRDGEKLVKWINEGLPLSHREQQLIATRLSEITKAVVFGQIVTAIIQGLVAMIGYWIFGVNTPVIWGLVTMFFSLIPFIGTAFVWIPASLYLFVSGLSTGTWWGGVGLFIYGVFFISAVDNILRPLFIGATSKMHHAIALLGVIGGVSVFGFIGIFAGPLVLALFITLYDILIRKSNSA